MSYWQRGTVAYCDRRRIITWGRREEITSIGRHMRGGSGVHEPLSRLWRSRRGVSHVQCGEQCLMFHGSMGGGGGVMPEENEG